MVLDTSLLKTQQYKVCIKGKVEQSREKSSTPPLHLGVVAIEKGAFWSHSTKGRQLTYLEFSGWIFQLSFYLLEFSIVFYVDLSKNFSDTQFGYISTIKWWRKPSTRDIIFCPTVRLSVAAKLIEIAQRFCV